MLFFIDRPLEAIKPTKDRPLSSSEDKLRQIYKQCYPIYTSEADYHIVSDNIIEHTIDKILEHF